MDQVVSDQRPPGFILSYHFHAAHELVSSRRIGLRAAIEYRPCT